MWNQLEISSELSPEVASGVQGRLNQLRADLGGGQLKKQLRNVHNLIDVDDGFLIWNPKKQLICHVQLKHANQVTAVQNLLLQHPPLFEVNAIKLNADHKFLLMSGRRALNVVEMPSKWATRLYEGGKSEIMVKYV
jgi:hypothetical protein